MASLDFENAKAKGVSGFGAVDFMAYDSIKGKDGSLKISLNVNKTAAALSMAQDAALTTAPNIGAPAALYTYLNPQIIEILFTIVAATKLFHESKMGEFTDDYMQFPQEEVLGSVGAYSDFGNSVSSDVNYEFLSREQFRFQTNIKYGDLEVAKASVAKIQLAARKQYSAATNIERASNRFYLYGVKGKALYGALNDPNLPATISPQAVTINGSAKSTWADKATDTDHAANWFFADIVKLVTAMLATAGGHIDDNSPFVLGMSNSVVNYLNIANAYGKTAKELIKENYPQMQFALIPELSTAEGEILYLTVPELAGVPTGECCYTEKFRLSRLVSDVSCYRQKAVGSTWGCVIKRPMMIQRMKGI